MSGTTHECPGGCGAAVPRHLYACKACWYLLPRHIQRRITQSYRSGSVSEHVAAMEHAADFYREGRT